MQQITPSDECCGTRGLKRKRLETAQCKDMYRSHEDCMLLASVSRAAECTPERANERAQWTRDDEREEIVMTRTRDTTLTHMGFLCIILHYAL